MIFLKITARLLFLGFLIWCQNNIMTGECQAGAASEPSQVLISIDKNSPMQVFGATKIEAALNGLSLTSLIMDKSAITGREHIQLHIVRPTEDAEIEKEGFRIHKSGNVYAVSAIDNSGAMYGLMELAEQIEMQNGLGGVEEKIVNPRFPFRAIKYNLPWVSYRSNEALQINKELSKDLNMWRAFLDMMAEERLNALTLWSLHPFPYMIKAKNFPKATPFTDAELAEWKTFWTALFKIAWMMRNEDFFRLRWGEPDFIREHIKINGQDYVGGYFIGSECYIPAMDIYHKQNHPHVNWKYAFERQWLYYMQWGRLLYNPTIPDAVFVNAFDQRYAGGFGEQMVEAYKLSTRTTQRIASFFNFTWDHSFYTEGFIGNKRDFIKIDEVINSDPIASDLISIREYGDGTGDFEEKVTPLQLAAMLETDNQQAFAIVNDINTTNETLKCEIEDVKAWAHLGLYFAKKLRTAVALNQNKKADAVRYITEARQHWRDLVAVTDEHIQKSQLEIIEGYFHWKDYQDEVDAEIDWVRNQ